MVADLGIDLSIDMKVVIQEERTGCGIASVANIINLTYSELKTKANGMGIYAGDTALYSRTDHVRKLLSAYDMKASAGETAFTSWSDLPDLALLSLKFRIEKGSALWHWVVFKRVGTQSFVLDLASYLK